MTSKDPFPVIVCDRCGHPTPARFAPTLGLPAVGEQERHAQLRDQGWTIAAQPGGADLCPTCTSTGAPR